MFSIEHLSLCCLKGQQHHIGRRGPWLQSVRLAAARSHAKAPAGKAEGIVLPSCVPQCRYFTEGNRESYIKALFL